MTASSAPQPPESDDGVDRLLRDYFQSKLPRPFPRLPLTAAAPATPRGRAASPMSRGRLVLAACVVAAVLGFGWLLNNVNRTAGLAPVGIGNGSEAKGGQPHVNPMRP